MRGATGADGRPFPGPLDFGPGRELCLSALTEDGEDSRRHCHGRQLFAKECQTVLVVVEESLLVLDSDLVLGLLEGLLAGKVGDSDLDLDGRQGIQVGLIRRIDVIGPPSACNRACRGSAMLLRYSKMSPWSA